MLSFLLLCLSCLLFVPSVMLLYKNPMIKGRYILIIALIIQTIITCWSDISTSYNREINIRALKWDFISIYLVSLPVLFYFLYINKIRNFLTLKTIFLIAVAVLCFINSAAWKRGFPILSKKGAHYDLVNINHSFWHILVGYIIFDIINSSIKK